MIRVRHPPLLHPLASVFHRAVDSVCAALSPESHRHYRGTVRNFLNYLGAAHPDVTSLDQLRREPHLLGWMSRLRSQVPPLATSSYINQLIALRPLLTELAYRGRGQGPGLGDDDADQCKSGVLRMTRAALPLMMRNPGSSILNLGSVAGHTAYEGGAAYRAAKAGELQYYARPAA